MRKMQLVLFFSLCVPVSALGCRNNIDLDRRVQDQLTDLDLKVGFFCESYGRLPNSLDEVTNFDKTLNVIDPWGNELVYSRFQEGYELRSRGPKEGDLDDFVIKHVHQ
jgi:hypothetical protein